MSKAGPEVGGGRPAGAARRLCLLPTAYCLLLLTGCAPSPSVRQAENGVAAFFAGDYNGAQRRLAPVATQTDENFVLNNVRLGSAALADYDLDTAESAFLRAYEVINSVGVNDGGRSLGAALVSENLKVWKGEPYERAMANFYLGLVYYMRHDYANARAAFENSLFKLRDYGEGKASPGESADKADQYRVVESDFALGYLMLAKCWQRLGDEDKALKYFNRVPELRNYLLPLGDPQTNKKSNLLLVVDFGFAPRKVTSRDGAFVGFRPTPREAGPVPPPVVIVDGSPVDLKGRGRPPVDLVSLAQERQWQDIDTIRTVKTTIGTGLIAGGAYQSLRSRNGNGQAIGLGLVAAGLLLKAGSHADVRQWEMLPRTTFVLPLDLEPGRHDVTVEFPAVPGLRQTWRGLVVPNEGEATYYIRMERFNKSHTWPPPAVAGEDPPPPQQ